jgi:hypothetical protein
MRSRRRRGPIAGPPTLSPDRPTTGRVEQEVRHGDLDAAVLDLLDIATQGAAFASTTNHDTPQTFLHLYRSHGVEP